MQRSRVTFWVVVTLLAAMTAMAQGSGRIAGRVTKSDGGGLGGVVVIVNELSQATTTDANGNYVLERVPPGSYTVVLSAADQTETISDIQVNAGATTTVDRSLDWQLSFADSITVYSASRKTERIVEAPAAVTVVTEQELAQESATGQLPKVIESAPGVDYTQSGLYDINFNTRGFNSSLNRRILTLIDGRDPAIAFLGAQEWAALSFPLDEMASVELVRGPGSALYGANAFNGVLNMTTKQPRLNQGGKIQLSGGELGTARLDARFAGTMGNELYYRVVGGYQKSDDWTRSRNVAPEYAVFCPTGVTLRCLPREVPLPLNEDQVMFGGLRIDKHFTVSTLTLEGGYTDLEGPTFQTGIGRVQVTDTQRPWLRFNYNMPRWNFLTYYDGRKAEDQVALSSGARLFEDSHNFKGELQGNFGFSGGKGRIVGGLAYNAQEVDTANNAGVHTLMTAAHDEHQEAVFGQLDYDFTTALKVVLAGRYDESTLHDPEFSPKASLVFGFNQNNSLRLTYNEAFQVPNYSEFFLSAPAGAPTRALAPLENALRPFLGGVSLGFDQIPVLARGNDKLIVEEIVGYEAGYSGIFGGKLYMTLDYYQNKVENFVTDLLPGVNPQFAPYQPPGSLPPAVQAVIIAQLNAARVNAPVLAGLTMLNGAPALVLSYANAGKVDTQGVEVAFNYYITTSWVADFNYSWFDFEVKEQALGDKLFPNAPENKFNVGLAFRQPRWDASVKYRSVEEFFWAAGVFAGDIPQYEVINFAANFRPTDQISVGANISNVADDSHYEAFGGDLIGRRALGYVSYSW